MRKILLLPATLLICCLVTPSLLNASINFVSAQPSGSWTASMTYDTEAAGAENVLEAFIIFDNGAGPFEATGITGLTPVTWSTSTPNSTYSLMTGPVGELAWAWDFEFAGDITKILRMDFLAWDGGIFGSLVYGASIRFEDGQFIKTESTTDFSFLEHPDGVGYDRSNSNVIPEPTTLITWGVFAGMGLVFAPRRRKNQV